MEAKKIMWTVSILHYIKNTKLRNKVAYLELEQVRQAREEEDRSQITNW